MGAGASMEEDYSHSHPPEPTDPQGSIVRHRPPSTRNASRANSRPLSRTGSNASGQWRAALRTASLSQSKLRKMRAAALGRKSACTVTIGKTGFSLQHIQICEGQVVSFQWSTDDSKGYNVTQVCHDGDQYKPVIGGFNSGPLSRRGFFEQQFNLEGEYKFVSAGIRCTPLTVEVYKKKDIEAELTDEGFSPQLIRIDQGSSIRWTWSGCSIPHSLVEVKYSHKTGTLVQKQDASRTIPTKANTCRKDFKNVGIYYFQTEGTAPGEMHTCVVHVRERQTEYRIEIQDRAFDAPILVIQEGDRVWLWWDKQKCRKLHCPYQIDLPPLNHPNDESYKPRKNGFKWPAPSKSGLLSQEFFEAGVYYFSDHNYEEAAEYIGTIIVKPKQKEHFIELSPEGFSPDLIYAESGDRVWWDWVTDNANVNFAIMEVEKCISPVGGRPAIENEAAGEGSYTDDALERLKIDAGLETVQLGSIGVYHYKVADNSGNMSTCSIISRGGSKNHTVHVTDTGFEPKVVTVHPGDRLWWIWQEGSKQHNIIQVSHNGNQIGGGFCSGAPLECPSAYTCQFRRPGVYYYISEALPKLFGAVVVTSQPTVHEVQVNTNSIVPDPLPININDVVAWTFKGLRQNDLKQVTTVDQVLDAQNQSPKISPPRRCLNRLFTEKGVYHFASKSLSPKQSGGRQPEFNDRRISSVLVDELSDSAVVRVDSRGFHPDVISIKRGMSILWTWKESGDEAHNIIHVNTPNSDAPLSAVQGSKSFNSGRPVPQNCFLYTFDDAGTFCVASQGAPGFAGSVNIIADEQRTEIPRISTDMTGGSVEKFHVVRLECNTPNSQIFFTIDGTAPELHKLSTKISELHYIKNHLRGFRGVPELYDPEQGVALKKSGLTFVRAVATCDGIMSSKIYTSNRFWVLSGEERSSPEPAPLPAPDNTDQFHWWNCVPQIRAVFTKPGEMEVFWESPPKESRFMLRGYQLFLNGVSYCDMIPPNLSSVTVAGMAGGRIYEVLLEAYPTDNMYLPHKSNKLMMNCVKTTDTSGPVISLETAEKDDTMVIVWMSISTDSQPIEGYRVYLNGQMCGNQVVPDANSDRCKVVIEGCQLDFVYRVVVAAVPSNGSNPKMSNEMEVTLPLDQRYIRLPPKELRSDDDDLYREYIEVHEEVEPSEQSDENESDHFVPMIDLTGTLVPDRDGFGSRAAQNEQHYMARAPEMYTHQEDPHEYQGSESGLEIHQERIPRANLGDIHHMHDESKEYNQGSAEINYSKENRDHDPRKSAVVAEGRETPDYQQAHLVMSHDYGKARDFNDPMKNNMIYANQDGSYEEESDNELGPRAMRMVADATAQQEPDSVQDSDTAPTTNKESRRNEVRADRDGEQAENSTDDDEGVKRNGRRRKKRRRGQRRQDKSSKRSSDISTPEQGYRDHDDSFPGASSEGPRALSTPKAGMVDEETMTEFSGEGWQTPHPPESAGGHTARSDGTTGSTRGENVDIQGGSGNTSISGQSVAFDSCTGVDINQWQAHAQISIQSSVRGDNGIDKNMHHVDTRQRHNIQQDSPTSELSPTRKPPSALQIWQKPPRKNSHMQVSVMDTPDPKQYGRDTPGSNVFVSQAPPPGLPFNSPTRAPASSASTRPVWQTVIRQVRLKHGLSRSSLYSKPPLPPPQLLPPNITVSYPQEIDPTRPPHHGRSVEPEHAEGNRVPVTEHHLPGSRRPPPDDQIGFIDAMGDPWTNKMKSFTKSMVPTGFLTASNRNKSVTGQKQKGQRDDPGVHYQVEVEEEPPGASTTIGLSEDEGRKRGSRTVMVPVTDTEHIQMPEPRPDPAEPSPGVTIGISNEHMPVPVVEVANDGVDSVVIQWKYSKSAEPLYRLLVNDINIAGPRFSRDVNSNLSYECLQEDESGTAVSAIQHCWKVLHGNQCTVKGLLPGVTYTIYVVAHYALAQSQQPCEIQAKSLPIKYTTLGPPPPPVFKIVSSDLNQVTLAWDLQGSHKEINVLGFQVLVDGQPLGGTLNKNVRQTVIDNLHPGHTVRVAVVTLTDHNVGNSEPSNVIKVTCPGKPPAPMVTQQPSYKKGSVIVSWERPLSAKQSSYGEEIVYYKIYVDGQYQGEVKATSTCDRNGYQYYLTDLRPGQSYDINMRSYAGQSKIDPTADQVFAICESELSNSVPVMCPAPPISPHLRLEGMHLDGIDVTWEMPQQYGDASVSGYQMLKDGKVYGSIIPPDVHSLRVKGLSLGDRVELQILALTDHPVGRGTDGATEGTIRTGDQGMTEVYLGDRYSACTPGPKLLVHYTGLVEPPARVWCEHITGHSAVMVWSIDQQPRPHFVPADSYQVTWWPGNKADNEVHSQQTKDDHLEITGLRPNATYNVVVEARKLQKYAEIDESGRQQEDYLSTFILTAKSDSLSVTTASPPQPPSNLGVIATTCHSIQLSWDPPQEKGVDIIGIRVDAVSVKNDNQLKHSCVEVVPSATSAVVDNLSEKSEYLISVTTITEEYFEQLPPGHELKSTKIIPKNRSPKEDIWLPSTSIIAMTSGTDAPSDVQVVRTTVDCVSLKWKPATVYGSNRLQGTVVRWAEGRFRPQFRDESGMANHRSMMADSNEITIQDLQPGILYKFVVEAVVSVKTTLESQSRDPEYEKQNRRTTHVMSRPVLVRTRAPCEPPRPIVTGYTTNTIQLYWEKPLLYSVIGRDLQDNPKYLKLSLEGYRLMINDKPHMRLSSSAQSCTLIKCKPGKTYKIVLIACTCTEEVKRERRKKMKGTMSSSIGLDESFTTIGTNKTWETVADDFENDESPSVPIEVTIPNMHDGFLSEINAAYLMPATNLDAPKSHDDFGDVQLDWALQGVSDIVKQFNMSWTCEKDGSTHKKVMDPDQRHCVTPVSKRKCVYDVVLDADYNRDVSKPFVQKVQVLIPGSPDAPEIWTKSVDDKEFIIEWGQPRCYGVKISGYQVYLNGKKVGNQLSSHHRKAVVPCKPKRQYRVNLVALSADKRFPDSEMSNTLMINTGSMYASALLNTTTISDQYPAGEDDDMMLRAVRVTEATIHLDWSQYTEVQGMMYYRVKWSSVAQPAEREVKLPAGEKSCVIHKCYPGTNHFVRLYAMGEGDMILDKSRQLTVQTSAPPDSPNVLVRACNFKYIAVQWDKPACYGDAAITGYKIYVNGVVEALLGPDQFTFTFTHGQWCREYVFQVQALTAVEKLGSKPSEPLVVLWPGIQPPVLRRAPAVSSNTVKVTWDHPSTTDGVQVKQYKVVVLDEATERAIQIISPIHPHSNEAEIQNLKQGSYLVYLEVHVHGSTDVVKSAALHIQPCLTPDPPHINVTVIGLEERRAIEKITCDLVNKRDRLLNVLGSRELPGSPRYNEDEQALAQAAETLTQVEDMLDDCLQSLEHYTGHLLAHVSWTSPQSNPDMQVSGYKVLVDGKQYGTTLHAGIKSVRVKLGLEEVSHKISMVSVVDHPHTISVQSNSVEVMTEPFLPFSFYSFFGQVKTKKSPGPYYRDALGIERKQLRRPINQGLLKRQVPPPSCTLLDIVEGEYRPLFPPSGPKAPTAILFWSKWCPYSTKTLSWFVRFARQHSSQFEFMAVACEPGEITADIRQDLLKSITENGWREDNCIRHVISQALAETTLQSPDIDEKKGHNCYGYLEGRPINNLNDLNEIRENGKDSNLREDLGEKQRRIYIDLKPKHDRKEKVTSTDITELFGVIGVPTLLIVHPQDYIAWKGRYCAFDYASFEHFISFVFSQTLGRSLPHPDPWDANIDKDALNGATKRRYNEKDMLIHRPTNGHSTAKTNFGGAHTTIHLNGSSTSQRPVSAKKLFYKSKKDDQITVNMRPYSATMESPYSQKLTHSSPPRRARSGRSSKSKTKY